MEGWPHGACMPGGNETDMGWHGMRHGLMERLASKDTRHATCARGMQREARGMGSHGISSHGQEHECNDMRWQQVHGPAWLHTQRVMTVIEWHGVL